MSIPLDRLYHYIESVARDVYGDTVIYRFYPHGSKKLEDLNPNNSELTNIEISILPQIFCYDQEPLMFSYYQNSQLKYNGEYKQRLEEETNRLTLPDYNIRSVHSGWSNIYDKAILLHSEQRSSEVDKYLNHQFIPVYYWSHALLALDWFRYAQYQKRNTPLPYNKKTFLIYNRAWNNTREYRLKFMDLIVDNNLTDYCNTKCNVVDPDTQVNYHNYTFRQPLFKPQHIIENYFEENNSSSHSSADFDLYDYSTSDIEIVLETLFDDARLHLTEKSLRPIACRKPFILCATHGSLEYLRNYGFKTFNEVFDESYDTIVNPVDRLQAIINVMTQISQWDYKTKKDKLHQLNQIAEFNYNHFFSNQFESYIINELKSNLRTGLDVVEKTNTSNVYINLRKQCVKNDFLRTFHASDRQVILKILKKARTYYNQKHNKY